MKKSKTMKNIAYFNSYLNSPRFQGYEKKYRSPKLS